MTTSRQGTHVVIGGMLLSLVVFTFGCAERDGGTLYADLPAPSASVPGTEETATPDAEPSDAEPSVEPADSPADLAKDETPDQSSPAASAQSTDASADELLVDSPEAADRETDGSATENSARPPAVVESASDADPQLPTDSANADNPATAAMKDAQPDTGAPTGDADAIAQPDQPADGAVQQTADAAVEREIKLLVPEKRFKKEGDAGVLRVSYDDIDLLKVLNMEPVPANAVDYFPDWLKALDGQRIRLRGFMFPTFVAEGISSFGLARDNGICCFVKEPKIYDMIQVSLADGVTTDYIDNRPFDVEGIFRIDPDADDTELFQLYRIEDAVVVQ